MYISTIFYYSVLSRGVRAVAGWVSLVVVPSRTKEIIQYFIFTLTLI